MSYAKYMSDTANRLARAVTRLNRRLRQERQSDLSPSQLAILGDIFKLGVATPGQIAEQERVQPPTITRMINGLEADGIVTRRQDPTDGRQVLVELSELGIKTLASERERRDAWLQTRLSELSAADRAKVEAAIDVLTGLAGCE
jgi:DNA-binding MarR family transcriptional regulator